MLISYVIILKRLVLGLNGNVSSLKVEVMTLPYSLRIIKYDFIVHINLLIAFLRF